MGDTQLLRGTSILLVQSSYTGCVFFYFGHCALDGEQERAAGLASRLQQREEELADAAVLMTETRQDLTALRDRAKEREQVRRYRLYSCIAN